MRARTQTRVRLSIPGKAIAAVGSVLIALVPLIPAAGGVGHSSSAVCAVEVPVLVVGGTPAGVAAAVAASRMGVAVLLTEARPYLGGDLTGPMLNIFDLDFGPKGEHLARGVFMEIYRQLGTAFDVEVAKQVFLDEVRREPLVTLRLNTRPLGVITRDSWISGIVLQDSVLHETYTVCAKRIVDATDDADVAAMTGVPYTLGREGSGVDRAMMSATLIFEVGGVNWRQIVSFVSGYPDHHHIARGGGIYHGNVWGYGQIMRTYVPLNPGVAIYDLNIGLQNDRSVLINGLLIFGVDGTDPASVAEGMRRGRAELPSLIEFLRAAAPGFSQAYLIRSADYLYIRETRHMRGLYTLTAQDIVDSRVFWDAIGVASYPIDLHPYRPHELNPYAPRRYVYTVPFRALVPVGVDNLVMAGRAISASYEAAGSARIVPTTMEEGQAAGAAAVLSLRERASFRQFAERPEFVRRLQGALDDQGAYLLPETLASIGRRPDAAQQPPRSHPAGLETEAPARR